MDSVSRETSHWPPTRPWASFHVKHSALPKPWKERASVWLRYGAGAPTQPPGDGRRVAGDRVASEPRVSRSGVVTRAVRLARILNHRRWQAGNEASGASGDCGFGRSWFRYGAGAPTQPPGGGGAVNGGRGVSSAERRSAFRCHGRYEPSGARWGVGFDTALRAYSTTGAGSWGGFDTALARLLNHRVGAHRDSEVASRDRRGAAGGVGVGAARVEGSSERHPKGGVFHVKQPENAEAAASFSFEDTPLARELADLTARRRALETPRSRSQEDARPDGLEPEGRRRQDDDNGQPCGGARVRRRTRARDRPRPAGKRLDSPRGAAHGRHPVGLRRAHRRVPLADIIQTSPSRRTCCVRRARSTSPAPRSNSSRRSRVSTGCAPRSTTTSRNLDERLDFVLIDCPPSLGLLTINAFTAAKELLIPIQCEYYALEGLSQLLGTVRMIQRHLNPQLSLSTIVLTMYDGRTRLAQQVAEEVRTHFAKEVLHTVIPRSVRVSEAPSFGQTVIAYDGQSAGAIAYREAAVELIQPVQRRYSERKPDGQTNRIGPRDRRTHPDERDDRRSTCRRPLPAPPVTATALIEREDERSPSRAHRGPRRATRAHRPALDRPEPAPAAHPLRRRRPRRARAQRP